MRMQIRILDPHWKKKDPNPGYFFKKFFQQKIIFFAYFYPKTWWTIQEEIIIISLFSKSSDLGFRSKKVFFSVFGWFFTLQIFIRGSVVLG